MRKKIQQHLGNTLKSGFIPELLHYSGKVRDVSFTDDRIIMVSTDRVSCFDNVLSRQIPFKGRVLNLLSQWAFNKTKDIVPNAVINSPHPNVIIQKKMKKIMFECVVRGFVWGSMAAEYEDGAREFCGIKLPSGMLRYEQLKEPIFTPATKAPDGEHDINVSFDYMAKKIGKTQATELRDISMKLFRRATELAKAKGFVFIDTKYEFGLDENDKIHLIDEANTPDSSRYCKSTEYEKFKAIEKEMKTGKYANVPEMLKKNPRLKIEELSKQFVRDVLVEGGYKGYGGSGSIPDLTDEQVIETSYRYIHLYEEMTGKSFDFSVSNNIGLDVVSSLVHEDLIKGGICVIIAGSDSDKPYVEKIGKSLELYGIPTNARICSAHKQPERCLDIIRKYNDSLEPVVIIAIAGGTDALSGLASFHSVHPVISCPPDPDEFLSCIDNPSGSSNSLVLKPSNAARHVAQILGHFIPASRRAILSGNDEKIKNLEKADG